MREQGQLNRFNTTEYAIMRSLFHNNDDLIYGIRKVMLQIKPSKTEQDMLDKTVSKPEVAALIRKWLLPEIDGDSPLHQLIDLTNSLNEGIKGGKMTEQILLDIRAKDIEIDYIGQRLAVLCDGAKESKGDIKLKDLANLKAPHSELEQVLVNIIARNYLLSYIDSNMNQIKVLAASKGETLEEAKARMMKDKTK